MPSVSKGTISGIGITVSDLLPVRCSSVIDHGVDCAIFLICELDGLLPVLTTGNVGLDEVTFQFVCYLLASVLGEVEDDHFGAL